MALSSPCCRRGIFVLGIDSWVKQFTQDLRQLFAEINPVRGSPLITKPIANI